MYISSAAWTIIIPGFQMAMVLLWTNDNGSFTKMADANY